jgi:hypothetical protein
MLSHRSPRAGVFAGSNPADTMDCPCEKTLELLAANGGPHAKMVLGHDLDDVFRWTPLDLERHMKEEEVILGEYVRVGLFSEKTYRRILREHARFRAQIARTGSFDREELFAHAKMEDEAVMKAGLI